MGKSKDKDKDKNRESQAPSNVQADYPVGYKKPPQHTQFKPGQSGNARGRPKSLTTPADVVRKQLGKKITVNVGGINQKVAVLEAILLKHASLAATGNHKSTEILLDLFGRDGNDQGNHLPELLQEFRSRNAVHETADRIAPRSDDTEADLTTIAAGSRNEEKRS